MDVRVVAATNRNLAELVARGEFREDLLYRINLITLHLPPLRERRDDIPHPGVAFVQAVGAGVRPRRRDLTDDAVRYLVAQPWPGNVRQLRQAIERTVLMSEDRVLDAADFGGPCRHGARRGRARRAAAGRQHDDRRDREGDDREVDEAPRRQHLEGGAGARLEPRRAVSPVREVRDPGVSLRARFSPTCRRAPAARRPGAPGSSPRTPWLFAAELVFVMSFAVGLVLMRRFSRSLDSSATARSCSKTATSCRGSARSAADIDRLIRVYNRMVGSLRDERVRLEEQQQFLSRVLRESPGGILVLDFERRVEMVNPAAARLLQTRGADSSARRSPASTVRWWRNSRR